VIVRNFEPGQENPLHTHPENAHCIYILEGSGEVLRPDGPPVPIKAGQIWIVPRGVEHGIRNTGGTRLSYLGVTAGREPAGGGRGEG
jgi:quercetin dioxygenase-like cupin family protein